MSLRLPVCVWGVRLFISGMKRIQHIFIATTILYASVQIDELARTYIHTHTQTENRASEGSNKRQQVIKEREME